MPGEGMDQEEVDALAKKLRDTANAVRESALREPAHFDQTHSGEVRMVIADQQTEPDWCDPRCRVAALELAIKHKSGGSFQPTTEAILTTAGEYYQFIAEGGR